MFSPQAFDPFVARVDLLPTFAADDKPSAHPSLYVSEQNVPQPFNDRRSCRNRNPGAAECSGYGVCDSHSVLQTE